MDWPSGNWANARRVALVWAALAGLNINIYKPV